MILIVTNSLTGGGAERAMNTLANAFHTRGEAVQVVAINAGQNDLVELECKFTCLDRPYQAGFKDTFEAFRKFYNLVTQLKPDNIVLNCDLPEVFGTLLPQRFNLTIVEHSPKPFGTRKFLGLIIRIMLLIRKVDCVRVASHFDIWCMPKKVAEVIPNALPIAKFTPRQLPKESTVSRLVYVGRLANPQKNPGICLDIAHEIDMPVTFYGEGTEKVELQESARLRGIKADFAGQVIDPWELIGESDVLIIPSRFEGDGLVVVEAIMKDVKFLVSDIPDFRRFNLPKEFYCENASDFASRIMQLQSRKLALDISEIQKSQIIEGRNPSRVAEQWVRHFAST
jgi:glycosyltransferase involved in cell wall biosynthesis